MTPARGNVRPAARVAGGGGRSGAARPEAATATANPPHATNRAMPLAVIDRTLRAASFACRTGL